MKKLLSLFGEKDSEGNSVGRQINYQKMSVDLGLHASSFNFMKNSHNKFQNVQRLRNLYSSSEKTKPQFSEGKWITSALVSAKESSENIRESSNQEVKETLLRKIKDFRDLIHIYQRKNHSENSILPLAEFKTVLKGIGLNLSNQTLQRFMVNNSSMSRRLKMSNNKLVGVNIGERAATSHGYGQSLLSGSGVRDTGIDAREFLKYYI